VFSICLTVRLLSVITLQASGEFHFILDMLTHARSLRRLELVSPYLCKPATSASRAALGKFQNLESLRLQRFTLGGSVLQQQIDVRAGHSLAGLSVLELSDCGIAAREAQHLGALAVYMPNLRELVLPENKLNAAGVEALLRPWREGRLGENLRLLDLSRNLLEAAGAFRFS
jgi:Ran GTPase-activating protein (RanGAP) involved in mRNA processing and transport